MTDVAPLLPPIVRVTYTGSWFQLSSRPSHFALNPNRMVTNRVNVACRLTPPITPVKVKVPFPWFVKEPAGMVVLNVPTWRVTGWVTGLNPALDCCSR